MVMRNDNAPLMMPISGMYNDMGTVILGKVESGRIRKGERLLVMPNRFEVEIGTIYNESKQEFPVIGCGDNVHIRLRIADNQIIRPGHILSSQERPANVVTQFKAQLAILDDKSIICSGYKAVMHIHTSSKEITLTVRHSPLLLLTVYFYFFSVIDQLLLQRDRKAFKEATSFCQKGTKGPGYSFDTSASLHGALCGLPAVRSVYSER